MNQKEITTSCLCYPANEFNKIKKFTTTCLKLVDWAKYEARCIIALPPPCRPFESPEFFSSLYSRSARRFSPFVSFCFVSTISASIFNGFCVSICPNFCVTVSMTKMKKSNLARNCKSSKRKSLNFLNLRQRYN